jgi:hypothetical protein
VPIPVALAPLPEWYVALGIAGAAAAIAAATIETTRRTRAGRLLDVTDFDTETSLRVPGSQVMPFRRGAPATLIANTNAVAFVSRLKILPAQPMKLDRSIIEAIDVRSTKGMWSEALRFSVKGKLGEAIVFHAPAGTSDALRQLGWSVGSYVGWGSE